MLLSALLLQATQIGVLAEVFTEVWCPYCPDARSGLQDLYEGHDNVVPIIWEGDGEHPSPNYNSRYSFYGVDGLPDAYFGGTENVGGGGTDMYPHYRSAYNSIVNDNSPLDIEIELGTNNSGQLAIMANVELTGDITTTNNRIIYMLTYEFTEEYFCTVVEYGDETFSLNETGETGYYEHPVEFDPEWDLMGLRAIVVVQTMSGTRKVHQAVSTMFTGTLAVINPSITSGPANLTVSFESHSFPVGEITAWEWDFNGDGTVDSEFEDAFYVYDTPGTYDVSLTIYTDDESSTTTAEGLITVTDGSNVSGPVAGSWVTTYSPYEIVGDVSVPDGQVLTIDPGVEIVLSNDALFEVNGRIVANADDGDPILFGVVGENSWEGFKIRYTDQDNEFMNCRFSGATHSAIAVDAAPLELEGCWFYDNHSSSVPAAIDLVSAPEVSINGCLFANNTSSTNSGAIQLTTSSAEIKNNIFVNNTGSSGGAAIFKSGSEPLFYNNTVANNNITGISGGALFVFNSSPQIMNCILRDEETVLFSVNSTPYVDFTNIQGGYDGTANIDADPMFTMPSGGSGAEYDGIHSRWFLQEDSPCIDAGNMMEDYNDVEDPDNPGFALWPAMGDLTNDMGAYGGHGAPYVDTDDEETVGPSSDVIGLKVYPNPFNPETTIQLQLSAQESQQRVSLAIYNIRGQKVCTLLDNEKPQSLSMTWKGVDRTGKPVSSGIYFARMTTGTKTVTTRMALIK